jgi:hypothetical protein
MFYNILLTVLIIVSLVVFWFKTDMSVIEFGDFIGIIAAVLMIFGWWATYYFGIRKGRKQLSLDKKMEIYSRLVELFWEIQKELYNHFILNRIFAKREIGKDRVKYGGELSKLSNNLYAKFDEFYYCYDSYLFLMPNMSDAGKYLRDEVWKFHKDIMKIQNMISRSLLGECSDEDIAMKIKESYDRSTRVTNFLGDFMYLLRKELCGSVFERGYARNESDIENVKEGDPFPRLTLNGVEYLPYRKSEFQKRKEFYIEKISL